MTTSIDTMIKTLGAELAEDITNQEVSREAYMARMAEASTTLSLTVATLEEGVGDTLIRGALAERNALLGRGEPSKTEVSRFKTAAHPKVRGIIEPIIAQARALLTPPKDKDELEQWTANVAPLVEGKKRQQIAESMMSQLKKDDVSTVETASDNVLRKYTEALAKTTDPASAEGIKKSLTSKLKGKAATAVFTEDSLKAVLAAVGALVVIPPVVEPVAPVQETQESVAPAPLDLAAALASMDAAGMNDVAKGAAIAALLTK